MIIDILRSEKGSEGGGGSLHELFFWTLLAKYIRNIRKNLLSPGLLAFAVGNEIAICMRLNICVEAPLQLLLCIDVDKIAILIAEAL